MSETSDIAPLQEGSPLSILEHLNELRIRLTWAAVALMICTVISFIFTEDLLQLLLQPYKDVGINAGALQTLSPTEGIENYFKVSFMSGGILAMPFVLLQFWIFISPGLTKKERRYVYLFIPSAVLLFVIGISFAWFVLVPAAINFLANFMPDIFQTEWTSEEYIGFLVAMLFWLGVSFEMPVVIYVVARVGLVEASTLRQQWRFAIVGIAVLAAAITPSIDPITMLLTMAPLVVLYIMSIILAYIGYRQFEKSMAV